MIKVLCLDYDNTVFDHRAGKIPESAEKALEAVRGKCRIVLASGRFFNDVWNAPIKELIKPDGIIHSNGSMVESEGLVLKETFLDPKLQKEVLDFAYTHELCLGGLYEGNGIRPIRKNSCPDGRERSSFSAGSFTMQECFMKFPCMRCTWMIPWKRPG